VKTKDGRTRKKRMTIENENVMYKVTPKKVVVVVVSAAAAGEAVHQQE